MRYQGETGCNCVSRTLWLGALGCGVLLLLSATAVSAAPLGAPSTTLKSTTIVGVSANDSAGKVTICHKGHTISVAQSAIPAHFGHGDTGGACDCESNLCACSLIFDPVKCPDGTVYINDCLARCAGKTNCTEAAHDTCACPDIFLPVQCSDGKVYANQCDADCAGATGCHGNLCACTDEFIPVTCPDGETYANRCVALCAGQRNCGDTCECDKTYKPVQCPDGIIYNNRCLADCAGATGCSPVDQNPPGGPGCPTACDKTCKQVTCSDGFTYCNQCLATCNGQGPNDCRDSCSCSKIIDPVFCTSDGNTYNNACLAVCAEASGCSRVGEGGGCPPSGCECSKIYRPVTCDQGTFNNACVAACEGATGCKAGNCPNNFDPILCLDGNLYFNSCFAAAQGVACPK